MAKAPAFQLYAGDFLTDVMDWTDEEVGAHMRLLCWSWVNRRGIPRDYPRMTRIAPAAEKCWPTIGPKWKAGPDETWINEKLESTRANSDSFRARQSAKSELAVAARKEKGVRGGRKKKLVGQPVGIPNDKPVDTSTGHPLEGEVEVSIHNGKERATLFAEPELGSAALQKAFADFAEMRTKIRKPMTPAAKRMIISKLKAMGDAKALQSLQNSTTNNWTDVYEPRPNGTRPVDTAQRRDIDTDFT